MSRKSALVLAGCLFVAVVLWAATVNGSLSVLGTLTASIVDFTGAASTAPMKSGTALPSTCSVGQAFFKTDAVAGQNIYLCTATNSWTQVQGSSGGGGGTFDWQPSTRYIKLFTDFNQAYWNAPSPLSAGDFVFLRAQGTTNLNNPTGGSVPVDRAGWVTVTTTATANNAVLWYAPITSHTNVHEDGLYSKTNLNWKIEIMFRVPASTDLQNADCIIGLMSDSTAVPPEAFGVGYRSSVGNDFYWISTSNGVWSSTISTGVAADSGVWHKLKIRSDGTQTNRMYASFDNGSEISICPSGCTVTKSTFESAKWATRLGVFVRTTEAAQKGVTLDYLLFWMDRGAER